MSAPEYDDLSGACAGSVTCEGCGAWAIDSDARDHCDERDHSGFIVACSADVDGRMLCHFWPNTDAPKDPER